jgi:hypothetical protein
MTYCNSHYQSINPFDVDNLTYPRSLDPNFQLHFRHRNFHTILDLEHNLWSVQKSTPTVIKIIIIIITQERKKDKRRKTCAIPMDFVAAA